MKEQEEWEHVTGINGMEKGVLSKMRMHIFPEDMGHGMWLHTPASLEPSLPRLCPKGWINVCFCGLSG